MFPGGWCCFILGFSITHPMDVLAIPTAYKKYKNYLSVVKLSFEKENK